MRTARSQERSADPNAIARSEELRHLSATFRGSHTVSDVAASLASGAMSLLSSTAFVLWHTGECEETDPPTWALIHHNGLEQSGELIALIGEHPISTGADQLCYAAGDIPGTRWCVLRAPLITRQRIVGVIAVARTGKEYDSEECARLEQIAAAAASAIDNVVAHSAALRAAAFRAAA